MTIPLIVLAILSTVGGFIGVPYALVNRDINVIEHTLEPAVAHVPAPEGGIETHEADFSGERVLAVVSVLIALAGIGAGWVLFKRRPLLELPRILENKYYVDEIYDTTLVHPIEAVSREGFWKIIDVGVIDGLLHSVGDAVTEGGRIARYLSAGFVRGYAAIILFGALVLIGLFAFLWAFPR
jgi:NADH-quinone oxidoreductase subunit L